MSLFPESEPIDLLQLSDQAGVSTRTIRFYIQQGLLPAPETRGPGAHYGPEQVDRLLLIKRLQREHLPLAEIRKRIDGLRPEEITRLLRAEAERPAGSASDYVRKVLSQGVGPKQHRERSAMSVASPILREGKHEETSAPQRSQWERYAFSPDVELHVRRPVSREDNRRLERLLDAARDIFRRDTR